MIFEIFVGFILIGIFFCFLTCNCLRLLLSSSNQIQGIHQDAQNFINIVRQHHQRQNDNQNTESRRNNTQTSDSTCPICLNNTRFTIETNCGHKFCAICMIQYWHTCTNNNLHQTVKCPLCRQIVNCLLPLFTRDEQRSDDHNLTLQQVNNYNRRFADDTQNLISRIYDLPVLIRHLLNEVFSINGLSFLNRIRVLLISAVNFVYFVSPIDILPEALFGLFGYFDDIIFALMTLIYLSMYYRQIIANRSTLT